MKNKSLKKCFLSFLFICFISINVVYSQEVVKEYFPAKKEVPIDKVWKITFSDDFSKHKDNVYIEVLNEDKQKINVTIKENDKTSVNIIPPENGFEYSSNYMINIVINQNNKMRKYIREFSTVDEEVLNKIIEKNRDKFPKGTVDSPEKHNIQILYTEVVREENEVKFKSYEYNVDENKYFYPASSVKLSACLLALDKINTLKELGITKYSKIKFEKGRGSQTQESGHTAAEYIRKILLYSDNNSFNRLYEFLGQKEYNDKLKEIGLNNTNIMNRLNSDLSPDEERYTNPFKVYDKNGKVIYQENLKYNNEKIVNSDMEDLIMGWQEQKDFSYENAMSIYNLQEIMKLVYFKDYVDKELKLKITAEDQEYIKKYLEETKHKYLVCGGDVSNLPEGIVIGNKYGQAYGYFVDNAYVRDEITGKEYMITAVVYSNNNGKFDSTYEYEYCKEFLKVLGKSIVEYNREIK